MMDDIQALFPRGKVLEKPQQQENQVLLPLSNGHYLQLDRADLTAREQAILALLVEEESPSSLSPWYACLVKGGGQLPEQVKSCQFIHVHHSLSALEDREGFQAWLEVMRSLLPNRLADFQLTAYDSVFVLEQTCAFPIYDVLADTLATMEFDFGLRLSILVGQIWSKCDGAELAELFQAEQQLFSDWQERFQSSKVMRFSQLFLWGQGRSSAIFLLGKKLAHLIHGQDQLAESILALWEEAAVVTKAAQRLYIHRNTLQYRLDKWQDLTGLQLKELTDLAVCYQVLIEELF